MKRTPPTRAMVGVFLVTASLFLYVANLAVYEALAGIFAITSSIQLLLLGSVLGGLTGSFLLASILGMRLYNVFTRWYYWVSSVWIGYFAYLLLVSVVYGVLALVPGIPAKEIGQVLVFGSGIVCVYAIFHARNIRIARLTVRLANLPDSWKGRSAVWISDVHLGQLYGPHFARKIVKKVNALPHDIIFVGGDLFDGTGAPDVAELVAPLGQFSGHLGIYFITGNHEEFGSSQAFIDAVKSAHMRPLIDEMVEIEGLQLIGVDYHHAANRDHFRQVLSGLSLDRNTPSILLKHEPRDIDVAEEAGISFQISGHTHRAQMWPFTYIADRIYRGFSYGLNRSGEMQVYTSSGVGTWGPPMRVGTDCEIVHMTFQAKEG